MAIYNLPLANKTNIGTTKYPSYEFSIDLTPFKSGNQFNGGFVGSKLSGNIYFESPMTGVNYSTLVTEYIQGTNSTKHTIRVDDNAFYGNGAYISADFSNTTTPFQQATSHKIRFINGDEGYLNPFNVPSSIQLSGTVIVEQPYNINVSTKNIYESITITWDLLSNNKVDFCLYQGENEIYKQLNVTSKRVTIPSGAIKSTSGLKIVLKSHFTFLGIEQYANDVNYTLTGMQELVAPTIDNLRYVGADRIIEEPMQIAWTNVGGTVGSSVKYTLEAWQDGYLRHSTTNTGDTHLIPYNTFVTTNNVTVKIYNTATYLSYSATSAVKELNISGLTSIKPIFNDFSLSGYNIDYPITISAEVDGAISYAYIYNGKRFDGLVIPRDTISYGQQQITVIAIVATQQGNVVEASLTKRFLFTRDEPTIFSLEPSGLEINVDKDVLVSFVTSNFVDKWDLVYAGNTVSGTTARQHIVPKDIFQKGSQNITLITYYRDRQCTKTSTFYAYGSPQSPTLIDRQDVYKTARPTFKWELYKEFTNTQVGAEYRIVREDGSIAEQKVINNQNITFMVENPLSNSSKYTLWLRIKNKWNIYSGWTKHTFETSFTELPTPTLELYENGDNILISFSCISTPANFSECCIYRMENNGEWVNIGDKYNYTDSLIDYCITPNVITRYKVRLFDKDGAFSESETKMGTCKVINYSFADVEAPKDTNKILNFVKPTYNINRDTSIHSFANKKPILFKGNKSFYTGQLTCVVENNEIDGIIRLFDQSKVLCYKTYRGQKMYVVASIESITPINHAFDSIVITITEVNFNEELMYAGTVIRKLTYFNGEYKFDNTITFSGEHIACE